MKRNITYLLGAGASYHSIPVVDQLNKRMELFLNMSIPHQTDEKILDTTFYKNFDLKDILNKYRDVISEALKHKTVDTYAKKLFLQKRNSELYLLKEFLCLYFAFEQSIDDRKLAFGQPFMEIPKENLQSLVHNINCHLDYRYDVFFASLLDENMELPSNINIISWNYDHQLELAYMDYARCTFNVSKTKLKIFPHDKNDKGRIIKLNGSANQMLINGELFNFEQSDSKDDFFIDALTEIVKENDSLKKEYALNFAWEGTPIQKTAISLAKEIMENTDELIIIGYSFPFFNRNIDIDIVSTYEAQSIKVQCLETDFKGIQQSINDIFGGGIENQIHFHNDLSQFHIPSIHFYNE